MQAAVWSENQLHCGKQAMATPLSVSITNLALNKFERVFQSLEDPQVHSTSRSRLSLNNNVQKHKPTNKLGTRTEMFFFLVDRLNKYGNKTIHPCRPHLW